MMTQRFPIHLGRRSRRVLMLFGVRPSNAYVDLADDELDNAQGCGAARSLSHGGRPT